MAIGDTIGFRRGIAPGFETQINVFRDTERRERPPSKSERIAGKNRFRTNHVREDRLTVVRSNKRNAARGFR
jgi:hypothetical protein